MSEVRVTASQIKAGDAWRDRAGQVAWTALEDAKIVETEGLRGHREAEVHIRYADGGDGYRRWFYPTTKLVVER